MSLRSAILTALMERPSSGKELTRRFDLSIGYFWHATHQQIYKVLSRMESDGWIKATHVAQDGRPDKKLYALSLSGAVLPPGTTKEKFGSVPAVASLMKLELWTLLLACWVSRHWAKDGQVSQMYPGLSLPLVSG